MRDLVVYGVGELGQLYGSAALRAGLRVSPITRASDPALVLRELGPDVPVLVAVGESALDEVLARLSKTHPQNVILLQNELFPSQWRRFGLTPTVLVAWLLKKRGTPLLVARPSPVHGKFADLVRELHEALDVPCATLASERELQQAIVEKYAFILAINALGVLRDRTLSTWLQEDPLLVRALADEAARLGAALCAVGHEKVGHEIDLQAASRVVEEAMRALGTMSARGRSAQGRVARALEHAERLGLPMPELASVARTVHLR